MHFFTKLVFAAPESGLPSLPTALSSQHLFKKLVFAAPASGHNALVAMSVEVAGFWDLVLGAWQRAGAAMARR